MASGPLLTFRKGSRIQEAAVIVGFPGGKAKAGMKYKGEAQLWSSKMEAEFSTALLQMQNWRTDERLSAGCSERLS